MVPELLEKSTLFAGSWMKTGPEPCCDPWPADAPPPRAANQKFQSGDEEEKKKRDRGETRAEQRKNKHLFVFISSGGKCPESQRPSLGNIKI